MLVKVSLLSTSAILQHQLASTTHQQHLTTLPASILLCQLSDFRSIRHQHSNSYTMYSCRHYNNFLTSIPHMKSGCYPAPISHQSSSLMLRQPKYAVRTPLVAK